MSSRNKVFHPAILSEMGMPGNHCCHLSSHLLNVNYFEVRPTTLWTEMVGEKKEFQVVQSILSGKVDLM